MNSAAGTAALSTCSRDQLITREPIQILVELLHLAP